MRHRRQCWTCCAVLLLTPGAAGQAQQGDSLPYEKRGRLVEANQRALADAASRVHDALAAVLRRDAPDLLLRLEPPPPVATGYQLLPRIVTSTPTAPVASQPLSYSWPWSDELIAREMSAIGRLNAMLSRATGGAGRALADSMVADYRAMIDRKKLIDADVGYNWLWQTAYARNPAAFETGGRLAGDVNRVSAPGFQEFRRERQGWLVILPVVTDIEDSTFLAGVRRAVERTWAVRGDTSYRVQLEIRRVAPRTLYCGDPPGPGCAPPATGSAVDLTKHLSRFQAGVAVLTTGAASTHVAAGRAIVLGPHELPERTLAHEFGHLLGFPDAYRRTFRDAGRDGYVITEVVPDPADIMANPKTGMVQRSHFERLLAVRDVPALMSAGLDALYARHQPATAAARFRDVLARDPGHYGATYQLAVALGQVGDSTAARQLWQRVLTMAVAYGDSASARTARERLGRP